ncbi:MAG: agmatinase [Bacteroidetes bacterium]|nr:agmatinase [Bacteroidota bacterium]MBK9525332.1 agmatinase [Bacteroidota bacterium]MBK9542397.1 agmatinase [Bacteroidota bacterium]MBP6401274.1 agmatinase [Bacteroidia bacterium]
MKVLSNEEAFLAIPESSLCDYKNSKFVIQQVPYEHTSSYLEGSAKGPAAIVSASHFVEFYDEELDTETYKKCGIATLEAIDFKDKVDADAIDLIEQETKQLIQDGKYVVSLGAEHTVTLGFVKAHAAKYPDLTVLQIDAHSDLRSTYHDNPYSHASVMARIHDLDIRLVQIGIRAQCKEESDLIKSANNIHTFYAHHIRKNVNWMTDAISKMGDHVYLTIDADGFDPAVIPAVGTAEPNGLFWVETLEFLRRVFKEKKVVGFDVVECAPMEGSILSEYTLAKLVYRLIGYQVHQ